MKVQLFYLYGILLFVLLILGVFITHFRLFVVTSNSMSPAINSGDVLLAKSQEHYKIDDIVSFTTTTPDAMTTHRITAIKTKVDPDTQKMVYWFQTKGDANSTADGISISQDQILGKVIFVIPFFGYIILYMQSNFIGYIFIVCVLYVLIKSTGNKVYVFRQKSI